MSTLCDFITAQTAFQARQDTAIDGLVGDVKSLNDKITALQASAGSLSAEDQAALDAISVHSAAIADKLDALDSQTPPVAPPVEVPPPAPAA